MAPTGTVSAHPARMAAYGRATAPAAGALASALVGVPEAVAAWNARTATFGGRLDGPALAAVAAAATGLAELDGWTVGVGEALDRADRSHDLSCPAVRGPAPATTGVGSSSLEVVRDGADGRARVVRLALDRLPPRPSPARWRRLVADLGLAGSPGPLHLVVHGWGTTTAGATGAGEGTADLYDRLGRGATVLVVDWDAGQGSGVGWLRAWGDFRRAEASARHQGDVLTGLMTALAVTAPDVPVAISAHSLGNHVAARALSGMDDPSGRFSVHYLAIQAAIPARAPMEDPEHYGALAGPRVHHLTVTVNDGDDALFWYELQGPQALGDEAPEGEAMTALEEERDRSGLDTWVLDHDSEAGGGHLGLRPGPAQPLVARLTEAMVERMGG